MNKKENVIKICANQLEQEFDSYLAIGIDGNKGEEHMTFNLIARDVFTVVHYLVEEKAKASGTTMQESFNEIISNCYPIFKQIDTNNKLGNMLN